MIHDGLLAANGRSGSPHPSVTGPLVLARVAPFCGTDEPAAACELAARPESARAARDFTRLTLRSWEMGRLSDVAELVVSELVTNALRHGVLSAPRMPGEHPITLRLLRQDPYLMCMVTDPDTSPPVRIRPGNEAENGRGLQVVESCSVRWGWRPLDARGDHGDGRMGPGHDGKVVWALLQ